MRIAPDNLKSYNSRIGGHFILMLNGFITIVINWVLLVVVLIYFTPAVIPYAWNGTQPQSAYEFYYSVVVMHLVATSVMGTNMIMRSLFCPHDCIAEAQDCYC